MVVDYLKLTCFLFSW